MKKPLLIVAGLFACQTSYAQDAESDLRAQVRMSAPVQERVVLQVPNHYLTPEAGRFLMQTGYSYSSEERSGTLFRQSTNPLQFNARIRGDVDDKIESNRYNISAAYGLSRMFYIGARMDYQASEISSKKKITEQGTMPANDGDLSGSSSQSGIGDPTLFAGLRMRGQNLTGIMEFGFSPSVGEREEDLLSDENNALRGQHAALMSFNVFNHVRSSTLWGGGLSYQHNMEGRKNVRNYKNPNAVTTLADTTALSTFDITGGDVVSAESFMQFPDFWNASARMVYTRTMATTGRAVIGGVESPSDSVGSEEIALIGSARFSPIARVVMVPSLGYAQNLSVDNTMNGISYDSGGGFLVDVTLKMGF